MLAEAEIRYHASAISPEYPRDVHVVPLFVAHAVRNGERECPQEKFSGALPPVFTRPIGCETDVLGVVFARNKQNIVKPTAASTLPSDLTLK